MTAVREPSVTDSRPADASTRPAMTTFLAGEIVALVVFMFFSRRMWFGGDEWNFLVARTGGNLHDLFLPFYEHHWVTLPVLVYRGLWWVFGLRSYRPYQLVIVALHLTAAYQLRSIMRRVDVRPWTATLFAFTFLFFGRGYLNMVSPFQMTLVGSLVFGLAHLILATHDGDLDRRDAWGLAAGGAALMCSGVGITMAMTVGAAVLLVHGWRRALVHTVPLACAYIIWFAAIGNYRYPGDTPFDANVGEVATSCVASPC